MDSNLVVGPILLQRQCDYGKAEMTDEQWAQVVAERLNGDRTAIPACWTTFQWWWGSNCLCPSCGRLFAYTIADLERYRLPDNPVIIERERPSPKEQA